jgi:probable rRNA maturation factor
MNSPKAKQVAGNEIMVEVDLQIAVEAAGIPTQDQIKAWVNAAVASEKPAEVTVRIVDEAEITVLNASYRHKDAATNVLSFPFEAHVPMDVPLLGDVVICAPVVVQEAIEQHKSIEAHWAHLIVHGVLHLQGYDHHDDIEAEKMESREIQILHQFGYANPYEVNTAP